MPTYFTFPDGGLAYDCAACGQRCCRGKGFSLGADELVPLIARAPHVGPHLQIRAGGSIGAVDLTERCWFLDGGGLCELEVRHGRAAKPTTCRLFPFNRVFRVGDVRVIDFNSVLCPVAPAEGDGVRWADLEAEIAALAGSPLIDVPATAPPDLPADWLPRERAASTTPIPRAHPAGARLAGLDAASLAPLEVAVAPRVALLAPSLRWNAIFRRDAPPYERTFARLPERLRALSFFAALAARSLDGPPSLRGITELWDAQRDAIDVLARWDEPAPPQAPTFEADLPPLLLGALGALLAAAFRGKRTVGQLVEAAAAALPPEQRPLALALAARRRASLLPD